MKNWKYRAVVKLCSGKLLETNSKEPSMLLSL